MTLYAIVCSVPGDVLAQITAATAAIASSDIIPAVPTTALCHLLRNAQALEAQADLASLLRPRDPKGAAEIIGRLRAELRSGTRLAVESD